MIDTALPIVVTLAYLLWKGKLGLPEAKKASAPGSWPSESQRRWAEMTPAQKEKARIATKGEGTKGPGTKEGWGTDEAALLEAARRRKK